MFSGLIFVLHTPAVTSVVDNLKLQQIRKKICLLSKLDNNSTHILLLKAKQNNSLKGYLCLLWKYFLHY